MAAAISLIYIFPYKGNARQHEPYKDFGFMEDEEIWKDVIGYEGLYQISSMGKVKSLQQGNAIGSKITYREKIMKPRLKKSGYYDVGLKTKGRQKRFRINRLVAMHFIPNPENKPFVNHKEGIKSDNRMAKLEWCTHSENMEHYKVTMNRNNERNFRKCTLQISLDGFLIGVYNSRKEASERTNINICSIFKALNGKQKTAGSCFWA